MTANPPSYLKYFSRANQSKALGSSTPTPSRPADSPASAPLASSTPTGSPSAYTTAYTPATPVGPTTRTLLSSSLASPEVTKDFNAEGSADSPPGSPLETRPVGDSNGDPSMRGSKTDLARPPSPERGKSWFGRKKAPKESVVTKGQITLLNPQRTLTKELRVLVNNPDFCDIIFILEDKPLYAHRAILAARCNKFQQMFANIKDPKPEIPITGIRYNVFLGLMYYLYTDAIDISLEGALELMGAAAHFGLDLLKSLCEREIEQSIDIENVGWILQGADRFKATHLREISMNFAIKNFDQVSKARSFQELSRDLILEILRRR